MLLLCLEGMELAGQGVAKQPFQTKLAKVSGSGQWNEDQIREASTQSLEVLRGMGAQIKWIHSYVTDDKIYCVYLAPDETWIREHARQLGVPANRISAVRRMIDPVKYG